MAMQTVGKFTLLNDGGFVVKISFDYMDDNGHTHRSSSGPDIDVTQTGKQDPSDLGVPNGSTVWLHADVVWGDDNVATQGFIYQSGNAETANYKITGTTLNNNMQLLNITP